MLEMGEANQVWKDRHTQMLIERLTETLIQLQKDQSSLCRGIEELQIILNRMRATAEE